MKPFFSETKIVYQAGLKSSGSVIYLAIILLVLVSLCSLPFVRVEITVKASGIIRPLHERTEIKSIQTGIIDSVFYKEGDTVSQNDVILRLRGDYLLPKMHFNNYEILQTREYIHDLEILSENKNIRHLTLKSLKTPVYKRQAIRFIYQKTEQEYEIKKMNKQNEINEILLKDRIIAPKDHFDRVIESKKLVAGFRALEAEQKCLWQQELSAYRLKCSELEMQKKQLHDESSLFQVRTPIGGIVVGLDTKYPGGVIQSGETFCIISPEAQLIAECYISTQDVGLLRLNQLAKFQIDAFDQYIFGIMTGKIASIDNDFTSIKDQPVFKIKCILDSAHLYMKNGFKGKLKKGLTLKARFIVARRTAWQLLFDKLDNWINPVSQKA